MEIAEMVIGASRRNVMCPELPLKGMQLPGSLLPPLSSTYTSAAQTTTCVLVEPPVIVRCLEAISPVPQTRSSSLAVSKHGQRLEGRDCQPYGSSQGQALKTDLTGSWVHRRLQHRQPCSCNIAQLPRQG